MMTEVTWRRVMNSWNIVCATALLALVVAWLPAQEAPSRESDTLATSSGSLKITPVHHAALMLEWNGRVIDVDPWGAEYCAGLPKADLILITDTHADHLDPKAMSVVTKEDTVIVASEAAARTISVARGLTNGAKSTLALRGVSIEVEAVAAYNLTRGPAPGQFYHPKGRGNGYILTLGGKRVYISGDTECIPEIAALKDIDVAFICMNLPYTQTPQEAAECVKKFHPAVVYPYHYRGQDPKVFAEALRDAQGIEVRLRNWY
jgi:L-ascorbate metabolism protein UlaG (beta-lactamase superfamily)